MLTPADIRKRVEKRYQELLKSWPEHEASFPIRIPLGAVKGSDVSQINQEIASLRKLSREEVSHGYQLDWIERNSRTYGKNRIPTHAKFSDINELTAFLGKYDEWKKWTELLKDTQANFPEAFVWLRLHPASIFPLISHWPAIKGILRWRLEHPDEECYLREIPALPHSKFIEENSRLMGALFACILPEQVRADESTFERKHGFKKREHFFICRCLDPSLQSSLNWPFRELALHPDDLSAFTAPSVKRVLIVENQVNLHTLPTLPDTLAIHGSGAAVSRLAAATWLSQIELIYWGDLDEHGFLILSQLRTTFPHTRSIFMTAKIIRQFSHLAALGKPASSKKFSLTREEKTAHRWCRCFKKRIEQERLPNEWVEKEMVRIMNMP